MRVILVVALAALAACTGSANYWVAYRPIHGAKTTTVQKAVIAVTDAGKEVETSADGVVVTKWFSGDGPLADGNQFRIRIVVAADGYDIAALCQMKLEGKWKDECDSSKRPRFVLDAIAKIEGGL